MDDTNYSKSIFNEILNFKFIFSQDFDIQKQKKFLINFKNNKVFENYNLNENYTVLSDFNKRFEKHDKIGNNSSNFTITIVNNINEIEKSTKIKNVFFCGIVFDTTTKYSIYLHYNETEIFDFLKIYNYESIDPRKISFKNFYTVQAIIDNAIYKTLANSTNSKNIYISTKTMDIKGATNTVIRSSFDSIIMLIILLFTPCTLALLNHLVIEKESRIKESLLIIGLNNSSFWLSWAIIYSFIILFNSIIVTVIIYHFNFISFVHWSVIIVIMVIYGLSCCCLSFILSTFFKKSKIAMIIGAIVIFTFYIISDIILIIYKYFKETMPSAVIVNFFFSPSAFLFLFKNIMDFKNTGQTITLLSIFKIKNLFNSFISLVFTLILYFLIAIYLDNILPQGNNIHRKWHFIITDIFKNKNRKLETNYSNINLNNPFIQPDPNNQKLAVEVTY